MTGNFPYHSDRFVRLSAYGVVVQSEKVLLCRLSSELRDEAGKWTLPGGGVEFGENPLDALVREIKEETGLIVEPGELLCINSDVFKNSGHELFAVRLIFQVSVISGALCSESTGSTDLAQWHPIGSLGELPMVTTARVGTASLRRQKQD